MYETYSFDDRPKKLVLSPHDFSKKIKHTSVFYCRRCGLVPANNVATQKAIQKGCYKNIDVKD